MAPYEKDMDAPLTEAEVLVPQAAPRRYSVVYPAVATMLFWHLSGIYGLCLCLFYAKWATILFNTILYICAMLGVTAGAHRLWAHRSYKATLPLQVLLMLFQSLAYQHSALRFARDHRAHHKFSDTDADPYNPARGFFFAHIGWLLVRKHPQAITRGKGIHVDDLYQNPVLVFQNKYSFHLTSLLAFVLPALVPTYFWQESVTTAHHVSVVRVLAVWHAFFTTNSAAHSHGYRPYDKRIMPTQNLPVTFITLGEGFHNFHHVFPFDYRAAELGNNCLNLTTRFIDVFAWIGWAYDLKHASPDVIAKRSNRTGDGTDLWGRPKEDFVSDSSK
ncbi:acyl-CoA Delta(11) desaturase-like isoform X2 [Cydia fagiglandana]|uniref:acyl-CoA Delta(11) desaturase-like isoform X2 n=1 Tax=Cydia fagiglandana TaxID=1458189 RepID=UPI002FEE2398